MKSKGIFIGEIKISTDVSQELREGIFIGEIKISTDVSQELREWSRDEVLEALNRLRPMIYDTIRDATDDSMSVEVKTIKVEIIEEE